MATFSPDSRFLALLSPGYELTLIETNKGKRVLKKDLSNKKVADFFSDDVMSFHFGLDSTFFVLSCKNLYNYGGPTKYLKLKLAAYFLPKKEEVELLDKLKGKVQVKNYMKLTKEGLTHLNKDLDSRHLDLHDRFAVTSACPNLRRVVREFKKMRDCQKTDEIESNSSDFEKYVYWFPK